MSNTIDVQATVTPEPETAPTMAIATRPAQAVGAALTIDELHKRLEFIRQVMRNEMKEGQDFGKIPGTGDKPSLLQPGAQKLLMTFNLREQVKKETMRELPHSSIFGHREYELTITVFPSGLDPSQGWDGVGTCSTFESKYRYRKAERVCPECHKPTIIVGKAEYGGGFICYKKKGGCGAKFHDQHPAIISQPAEEVENEDPADCWNTVRKMAFKRALVAAAINATNTSELWTQDLEDLVQNRGSGVKSTDPQPENRVKSSQARFSSPGATKTPPANKTPQAQSAAQAPGANPPPREAKQAIFADQETLKRLLGNLRDCQDLALEYFRKLDNPAVLLPNEHLTQLPLEFVPVTRRQFENLMAAITDFGNGGEAKHAFAPNPLPPGKAPANKQKAPPKAAEPPPAKQPPPPSVQAAKAKDPEWFFDVVCPIPNKGQKRDEYMKRPDTIGILYDLMKGGDQAAQKRLWGFAKHWNPEPREFKGKVYPVSDADQAFREALDSFCEWEEKHGKDTERQQGKDTSNDLPEGPEQQEDDDLPF